MHLSIQILPVAHGNGSSSGLLVICRDISELIEAQRDLQSQLRRIESLQDSLRDQAIRDSLTGLFNRRYLQETLPRELARAIRKRSSLCLVMLDIDHFKALNDSYGHPAGDLVLQTLSQILIDSTRDGDIVTRFGGDEFMVLLVDGSTENAYGRAEAWRQTFENTLFAYEASRFQTSLSIGIASFPEHAGSAEQLVRQADTALYQAKSAGRNQTTILESTDPKPDPQSL